MKNITLSLLFALTALTTACAKYNISSDHVPNPVIASYQNFHLVPHTKKYTDQRLNNPQIHAFIESEVKSQMDKKGFRLVPLNEPADFVVSYRVGIQSGSSVSFQSQDVVAGDSEDVVDRRNELYSRQYDNGYLQLQFNEQDNDEEIWTGKVGTEIAPEKDTDKIRKKRIETAVTKLLHKIPKSAVSNS